MAYWFFNSLSICNSFDVNVTVFNATDVDVDLALGVDTTTVEFLFELSEGLSVGSM